MWTLSRGGGGNIIDQIHLALEKGMSLSSVPFVYLYRA